MPTPTNQVSDSLLCGVMLALSGGCMDAYSYLVRDHVFANAQTGNMLLLGVHFASGSIETSLKYLWPILSFLVAIMISDLLKIVRRSTVLHWRQITTGLEAVMLLAATFIPTNMNPLANALISFACGLQVETFRTIRGYSVATTMCIGNLRSGTWYLDQYLHTKKDENLLLALLYFGIILAFILGAVLESLLVQLVGHYALLLSPILLAVLFVCMIRYNPTPADSQPPQA